MDRDRAAELAGLDPAEVFAVVERGGCVVVIDVTGRKHVVGPVPDVESSAVGQPHAAVAPAPTVDEPVLENEPAAPSRTRRGGRR